MAKKTLTGLIIGLLMTSPAYSQKPEFKIYANGLIYSEQAMQKLSLIVDSLNLKYKTCNFNTIFKSLQQTTAYVLHLDSHGVKQAIRDIENNIAIDEFLKKYPKAKVDSNALILRTKRKNYEGQQVVSISEFSLREQYGFELQSKDLSLYQKDFTQQWLFQHHKQSEYAKESLSAIYFPTNFISMPLPKKYATMIGYADCIIDTTTAKQKKDVHGGWVPPPANWTELDMAAKRQLLDELTSIRVIGNCSMDNKPRQHAMYIALLAAETYNWGIFLGAHLDIMNDYFKRNSDGSYAWEQRSTYMRELEELNINVTDLIFGISFRMENPVKNHYHGSISRIGRALAETKNKAEIEDALVSIISDAELDYYNRLLFYYIFRNYYDYLKDDYLKKECYKKLEIAVASLPYSFQKHLASKQK